MANNLELTVHKPGGFEEFSEDSDIHGLKQVSSIRVGLIMLILIYASQFSPCPKFDWGRLSHFLTTLILTSSQCSFPAE